MVLEKGEVNNLFVEGLELGMFITSESMDRMLRPVDRVISCVDILKIWSCRTDITTEKPKDCFGVIKKVDRMVSEKDMSLDNGLLKHGDRHFHATLVKSKNGKDIILHTEVGVHLLERWIIDHRMMMETLFDLIAQLTLVKPVGNRYLLGIGMCVNPGIVGMQRRQMEKFWLRFSAPLSSHWPGMVHRSDGKVEVCRKSC